MWGEKVGRPVDTSWVAKDGLFWMGLLDRVACLGSWAVKNFENVGKWWLMELIATGG